VGGSRVWSVNKRGIMNIKYTIYEYNDDKVRQKATEHAQF